MPHAVPARPVATRLFVVGALALLLVIVLSILAATTYARATQWVEHTLQVRHELDDWVASMLEVQNDCRAYLASSESRFRDDYEQGVARARGRAEVLRRLVAGNPLEATRVAQAQGAAEAALQHFDEQVALVRSGRRAEALPRLDAGEGRRLLDAFRATVESVDAAVSKLLSERRAMARRRAWLTLVGASVVGLIAYGLLAFAWRRESTHEARVRGMARAARLRLKQLEDLATALAGTKTISEVAKVVVEHGMHAAGGDTCTLYTLSPDRQTLRLIEQRGVSPQLIERISTISATEGNPRTFEAMQQGRTVWVETEEQYRAVYPGLATANVPGRRAKAFWSMPLNAEGHPLGLLGVGYYEPRTYTPDDRAFFETLSNQCAQALLRATRGRAEEEARHWFQTTLRSIGDAVIATDERGRVTFVNPVAEELTGWSQAEALGQSLDLVYRTVVENTGKVNEDSFARALRDDEDEVERPTNTLLAPRTGPELAIDARGAPIRGEDGGEVGAVIVFRDVSQKKRQEKHNAFLARAGEALASSLDYQTTLLSVARLSVPELADCCAVSVVESGVAARRVATAHVDPAKDALASRLIERYPGRGPLEQSVQRVMDSGRAELHREVPAQLFAEMAQDAEHLALLRALEVESAMVVPLRSHGRTLGTLTFAYAGSGRRYGPEDLVFAGEVAHHAALAIENAQALNESAEAHRRERWLREEAERTNRLKDEFLATVSHELRTPLNAILGWTQILQEDSDQAQTERALAIIERNARAQATLIDDVLDVARVVSGKLALHVVPTSLVVAARAAIETVAPAASAKDITIETEVSDDMPKVMADAHRLQQVIWNLLSNAVKFTPKGGRVSLRTYRHDSDVCVSVQDDGEGIDPALLDAVFDPFRQADASTTRRHGGLGLGLSIVKHLVVSHGGSVHAHSDGPGHGSTFTVRLPVSVLAAARRKQQSVSGEASSVSSPGPFMRLDGLHVLVVDDEADSRSLVEAILRKQGAQVEVVASAAEARRCFNSSLPDVIVSDIGMPGEDGYSFIRSARARGVVAPAVALTAYASQQDAERAFLAGFQRHVAKPVEPRALVQTVADLGGRSM